MAKEAIENYYDVLNIPNTSTMEVIKQTIDEKLLHCEKGTPIHAQLLHIKTIFINDVARKRYDEQLSEALNEHIALERMALYKQKLLEEEHRIQSAMVTDEKSLSDLNQTFITWQEKRKVIYEKENDVLQRAHEKYIQKQQRSQQFNHVLNFDVYLENFEGHYKIMSWLIGIYLVCSVLYTFFGWSLSVMQTAGAYLFIILTIILALKAIRLLFARKLPHLLMALQDALFLGIMYTFFF